MKYFVGIDGGASKTELVVVDENEQVVAERMFGSSNLLLKEAAETLEQIFLVLDSLHGLYPDGEFSLFFGLSGLDTEVDLRHAKEMLGERLHEFCGNHWQLVNDGWIALRSGTDNNNAIVLISGTGSNCLGKNEKGELAKAGGMDYLLSDEGSGYEIGLMTLKAALRSFDGRDEKTILEEKVREIFMVNSIENLKNIVYDPVLSKKEIAALAKLCFLAQEEGDVKAQQILDQASQELFSLIYAVAKKLDLSRKNVDLVMVGGVIEQLVVRGTLIKLVKEAFPEMSVVFPMHSSAYGACLLAKEAWE